MDRTMGGKAEAFQNYCFGGGVGVVGDICTLHKI